MDIAIAIFFFFAMTDHAITLIPPIWRYYTSQVSRGVNSLRWWEYSVSSSIMLVLIFLVVGIRDIMSLICAFGANSAMIFLGLLHERVNLPVTMDGVGTVDWMPFIMGSVIGIIPWIALSVSLGLTQTNCLNNVSNGTYTVFTTTTAAATTSPPVNSTIAPVVSVMFTGGWW
jgi:hypothetical protein